MFCFVMIGKLYLNKFNEDEKLLINSAISSPNNIYSSTDYINEESEYNALFISSDIIYAVYNNFDSSSNTLTKAACFRKPLIANSNSTVGDRVLRYNLGEVAEENNTSSIIQALNKIHSTSTNYYRFSSYEKDHSFTALKSALYKASLEWIQ